MKLGINVIGAVLVLTGVVWFFQGIGMIQGSSMTNDSQWVIIGAILTVISAAFLVYYNRRRTPAQV